MHELSLARSLIDQLLTLAGEHQADKVTKVTVIIGPFSGIVAESFAFGFEALKLAQNPTRESILILETPSPEYTCLQCGNTFTCRTDQTLLPGPFSAGSPCPACGSKHCTTNGGDELILKQLEME